MCSDNWLPQIARPNRADRLGLKVVLPFLIQALNWWTDTNDDRLFVETLSRRLKLLIINLTGLLIGSANELTHIANPSRFALPYATLPPFIV